MVRCEFSDSSEALLLQASGTTFSSVPLWVNSTMPLLQGCEKWEGQGSSRWRELSRPTLPSSTSFCFWDDLLLLLPSRTVSVLLFWWSLSLWFSPEVNTLSRGLDLLTSPVGPKHGVWCWWCTLAVGSTLPWCSASITMTGHKCVQAPVPHFLLWCSQSFMGN